MKSSYFLTYLYSQGGPIAKRFKTFQASHVKGNKNWPIHSVIPIGKWKVTSLGLGHFGCWFRYANHAMLWPLALQRTSWTIGHH